jgi:hypothetical protein
MPHKPVVETVTLVAQTGRKIRKATRVILESGCVVTFIERLPKKKAIEQARQVCAKRTAQLGGRKWNGTKR